MLTAHEGHAQVCAVRTQRTGFWGPGTETPLPAIRPANHCLATSQPKANLSLKSPPGCQEQTKRSDVVGPRSRGGGRPRAWPALIAASQQPRPHAPGTRSSQTNGSDLERGHSGCFWCPDSGFWVSSPRAGAGSSPHICAPAPNTRFTGSSALHRGSSRLDSPSWSA